MRDILTKITKDIKSFESLALIGLGKNVGKTTTMNAILELLEYKNVMLSSIGYDGEDTDLIFQTSKPTIKVKEGMLLATAKKCLLASDVTFEILETTGFQTPLGEIVIARCLSEGLVELAGPSTKTQMKKVIDLLKSFNDGLVIVDGALNRKSFCDPSVCDKTILCTGMILSDNVDEVVAKTKLEYTLLSTPQLDYDLKTDANVAIVDKDNNLLELDLVTSISQEINIVNLLDEDSRILYLNGPLTNNLAKELIKKRAKLQDLSVIVKNGTQLFLSEEIYNRLLKTNKIQLRVLEPIDIYAIALNPQSLSQTFNSLDIINNLRENINVPIVDFVGGQSSGFIS